MSSPPGGKQKDKDVPLPSDTCQGNKDAGTSKTQPLSHNILSQHYSLDGYVHELKCCCSYLSLVIKKELYSHFAFKIKQKPKPLKYIFTQRSISDTFVIGCSQTIKIMHYQYR